LPSYSPSSRSGSTSPITNAAPSCPSPQ
jgi:hypothetical protein